MEKSRVDEIRLDAEPVSVIRVSCRFSSFTMRQTASDHDGRLRWDKEQSVDGIKR